MSLVEKIKANKEKIDLNLQSVNKLSILRSKENDTGFMMWNDGWDNGWGDTKGSRPKERKKV